MHAERLENCAHRAAGDDARASRRGAKHDAPSPVPSIDVMMQRPPLAQRHADQRAFGRLGRLTDRLGHLARLAVTIADAPLLVADDDKRREAEPAAALHHLGDAIDMDQPIHEFAVALLAVAAAAALMLTRHVFVPSSLCIAVHRLNAARIRRGAARSGLDLQKLRPPSRAPSASAFTRPWYI